MRRTRKTKDTSRRRRTREKGEKRTPVFPFFSSCSGPSFPFYSRVQAIESVTRNIVVKEKKNRGCPKGPFVTEKQILNPKWNKIWRSVSVQDTLQYSCARSYLFYRIVTLGSL